MTVFLTRLSESELFVLDSIQNFAACDFLNHAFSGITQLSVVSALWIAVGFMMAFSKRHRRYGIIMLFALALGTILGVYMIKPLVCRIRPYVFADFTTYIKPPGGYSFPSGHTLSSTASAFCIYRADRRAGLLAIITATVIAYSRMYFYVHFPTDILGGFIIGAFVASVLLRTGLPRAGRMGGNLYGSRSTPKHTARRM